MTLALLTVVAFFGAAGVTIRSDHPGHIIGVLFGVVVFTLTPIDFIAPATLSALAGSLVGWGTGHTLDRLAQ